MAKSNYLSWVLFIAALFLFGSADGFSVKYQNQEPGVRKPDSFNFLYRQGFLIKDQAVLGAKTEKVKRIYDSQVGVRERGSNSGPEVEQYLRYVGLSKGQPWCAAFVCWVYGQAGVVNPKSGWTPELFPAGKVIWDRAESEKSRSDVFGAESLKLKAESSDQASYSPGPAHREIWNRAESLKLKAESSDPASYAPSHATRNPKPATPFTADIFAIYFPEKGRIAHVGFIDTWSGSWLITVEGNTNESGAREGDGVYRKRRLIRSIYRVARYIN